MRRRIMTEKVDYSQQPFTIVSLEDNNTITFKVSSETNLTPVTLYVSTAKSSFGTSKTATEAGTTLATLNRGEKLYIRVTDYITQANYPYSDGTDYHSFDTSGLVALEGNIMSLLYHLNFSEQTALNRDYTFFRMFYYSGKIQNIDNLVMPATTLRPYCYARLFGGHTYLESIPENLLPATTLTEYCYSYMFFETSSVTSIPSGLLPATSLAPYCYAEMFDRCGVTSLPSGLLPATTLDEKCYFAMFYYCKSLVTISSNLLPATTLKNYCYHAMFVGCTEITTAPNLPATKLINNCYRTMFSGCTKLNYIKAMFTTTPSSSYTYNWVSNVASSGTFVKNSAATWSVTGNSGVPSGWTVQTASS